MTIHDQKTVHDSNFDNDETRTNINPGLSLGEYSLASEIGHGGMGVVFKAYQGTLERFVAIKILKKQFSSDSEYIDKFKNEARNAAKLRHPNIVQIYGIGSEKNLHYFIMELVEGKTLQQLIKEKSLSFIRSRSFFPIFESLKMMLQIAEGLKYAHDNGFLHRDIKPANIILDEKTNRLMIADFGLAQPVFNMNEKKKFAGTPAYMAPEMLLKGICTIQSDIYALGATFFELVTARPLFQTTQISKLLEHIKEDAPPLADSINRSIPEEVNAIIRKCTEKYPSQRYNSLDDMINDINLFLSEGRTQSQDNYKRFTPPKKKSKKCKTKSRAKNIFLLIVLAIISVFLIQNKFSLFEGHKKIQFSNQHCIKKIQQAKNYSNLNRDDLALPILRSIIKQYPDTKDAKTAKEMIDEIERKTQGRKQSKTEMGRK
ncbi:MAG: serine/threonine protein kinase [Candidatus Aureabacteria bacterium]|nr:serine/threonine protein kinase [Candidatus Auribacterota bacterium]